MGVKGNQTRERILATAESIILKRGFSGTSIEDIIKEACITKGGFFYHFDGKDDLAKNLMLRYLDQDYKFFKELSERAKELTDEPLQQLLIFLKLMAESMANLPDTHPGCLVASFTYEAQQFDEEISELNTKGVLTWRSIFLDHLERILEKYSMKTDKPLTELSDMLSSIIEGGIIMSKVLNDRYILSNQILQYRNYIRLIFEDS